MDQFEKAGAGMGCLFMVIWAFGVSLFVGFWGFVLYMAWKLVTHITGG